MTRILLAGLILTPLLMLPIATDAQTPRIVLDLEGGAVWQSYNDVEIPNNWTATRFSLSGLAGNGPWPVGRAYATWNFRERHAVRALYAPFSITESAVSDTPIDFEGARFTAGDSLDATYTFHSYRLSYRYRVRETERSTTWVGFTAKVRDATVQLAQGATVRRKDNVGFVPLLHVAGEWRAAPRWRITADADGLAGGPGRAVDASLKLGYDIRNDLTLGAGYRTIEGGADVDEVYSFAWLHYAVVSITWRP